MDLQALPSPYPDLAEVRKCLDAWRPTRPGPDPSRKSCGLKPLPCAGIMHAQTTPYPKNKPFPQAKS